MDSIGGCGMGDIIVGADIRMDETNFTSIAKNGILGDDERMGIS